MLCNYELNNFSIDKDYDGFRYVIKKDNIKYYLYELGDYEDLDLICTAFLNNYKYYSLVLTKSREKVCYFNNSKYILFKVNNYSFSIDDLFCCYRFGNKIKIDWYELWIDCEKYWESLYYKKYGKFDIIDESIDYYFSLLSYSIFYVSDYKNYYSSACIQHLYIDDEFFNPMNLKIDIIENDFAEYLKYLFFYSKYDYDYIERIIFDHRKLNYNLVIARLLFPNYYFMLVEKSLVIDSIDEKIISIINRIGEYQDYLNFIISKVSVFTSIKKISFS